MISFIIPVYNVRDLLTATIDSIRIQADSGFEIVLIDDGSTDGSENICDLLAAQYDFVRVIHQVNSGPSIARNTGIEAAKGDYLFFMDSDDLLAQGALSAMLISIRLFPEADLHVGQVMVRYLSTLMVEEKISYRNFKDFHSLSGRDALISMIDRNQFIQSVYSYVISKRLIDSIRLRFHPQWRNFEDFDFTVQAYLASSSIVIIDQPLAIYSKQRQGQITQHISLNRLKSNVEVTYQWIDHCFEQSDSVVYRAILSYLAHNYLFWLGDVRKLAKQERKEAYQQLMPLQVLIRYVKKPTLRLFVRVYEKFGFHAMAHAIMLAKTFKKS